MKNVIILMLLATAACAKNPSNGVLTISEHNTVSLNVPIMPNSATRVNKELLEKSEKLPANEPIYLVLNTPGGSIDDGRKIIEVAKSLGRPVHTVSLFNASMGFVISQYLDKRYVLESSTMMSHRAFIGGIRGEFPGSFISRFLAISSELMNINSKIAARAKMNLNAYLNLTANELWMGSEQSRQLNFADEQVVLRCDKSLMGYGNTEEVSFGIFAIQVQFHKCPLISEPKILKGDMGLVNMLVNKKMEFLKAYNTINR